MKKEKRICDKCKGVIEKDVKECFILCKACNEKVCNRKYVPFDTDTLIFGRAQEDIAKMQGIPKLKI